MKCGFSLCSCRIGKKTRIRVLYVAVTMSNLVHKFWCLQVRNYLHIII
jgi:hypothetical protein